MILADALARWHTVRHGHPHTPGRLFTGTDEHGQKVFQAAQGANLPPQQWANKVSSQYRELAGMLNVGVTRFIRTTDADHIDAVRHIWRKLVQSGDIYLGEHAGWYCVSEEAFYASQQVHERVLGKERLMVTKEGDKAVSWITESNYKFKLSKYHRPILEWLRTGVIEPAERAHDLLHYLEDEQEFVDLSVSRRSSVCHWGIPVPEDTLPEPQCIYVWLDALTNYLTVMGFPTHETTPDVHVLGKDICKFHAVYWPAFLMAANLPLPRKLIVHGHWTVDGRKMSKSLGNAVDPVGLVRQYGPDPCRYFLLRSSRLDADADFSFKSLAKICNNDLANQLGNLISRAFSPKFLQAVAPLGMIGTPSEPLKSQVDRLLAQTIVDFDAYQFHVGIDRIMSILQAGNRHVSEVEPWRLVKQLDIGSFMEIRQLLLDVGYVCQTVGILLQPVMPATCDKLLSVLAIPEGCRSIGAAQQRQIVDLGKLLDQKDKIPPLFPRIISIDN